jgi:very-short-patch-repair endonuclease
VIGMRNQPSPEQQELLQRQNGTLSRAQALNLGLTDSAILVRIRNGRWQRLFPGAYAAFSGEPGRMAWLWAALHCAGPGSVLSHQTAADLYGLLDSPAQLIHVTVPSGSRVARRPGLAIHYSSRLAAARHPALSPPRTRIEETVLDLAAGARSLDDALCWIFRACGSRRTTAAHIAAAMAARSRMRWRDELRAALAYAADGVHSLLEWRYAHGVERPHGLPQARRQRQVRRRSRNEYQDVSYEEFGTVVELDGRIAHPDAVRWRDTRRDNANAADGRVTLRYNWADVTERRCQVAAEVAAVLRNRGWTGVPRRCGSGCAL